MGVCVQPVPGAQASIVQSFWSSQFFALPLHVVPEHESLTVHSLPSSQPPLIAVCWHAPFTQASAVQELVSMQF